MKIDLRAMPVLVLNLRRDDEKRAFMTEQLGALGLTPRFIRAVRSDPKTIGIALSHLKAIREPGLAPPFLVLEDDCQFRHDRFRAEWDVPDDADALYLGHSEHGLDDEPDAAGMYWGKRGNVKFQARDDGYIRLLNMLSRHAILYLSERFQRMAIAASERALIGDSFPIPGDVEFARMQPQLRVLAPRVSICYQSARYGGMQGNTKDSMPERVHPVESVHDKVIPIEG